MKKLEFKTGKGKFVVIDFTEDKKNVYLNKVKGLSLKSITEEQCKYIVCKFEHTETYLDELFNRLKHKKIYLFHNPLGNYETALKRHVVTGTWDEIESKTFYNPFIFKL